MQVVFKRNYFFITYQLTNGSVGKLNNDLRPLFYAVALQCQANAYIFNITQTENPLLGQCITRAEELLVDNKTLTEAELSDLLVVISMYHPLLGHVKGIEQLKKPQAPYALLKVLEASLFDHIIENQIHVHKADHTVIDTSAKVNLMNMM